MSLFTPTRGEHQYVVSYMTLRRCVGWLGIALPVVLIGGFALAHSNCPTPPSISHYYYTFLGSYFTGTLCAVGLFLFAYNGPAPADRMAAFFAACCALGVVFCPTNACADCDGFCYLVDLPLNKARNIAHYSFASLLFATFAFFSLVLFTRTHADRSLKTHQKKIRNGIYYVCGAIILFSIACIGLLNIPAITKLGWVSNFRLWTFVFETSALFAFGISWLVKGEMIFPDQNKKSTSDPHGPIQPNFGISAVFQADGEVKQIMLKNAAQTYALANHANLNCTEYFKVCTLKEIGGLITDLPADDIRLDDFRDKGVRLI